MGRSGLNSQLILSTEQHLSTAGTNECTNKTERKKKEKKQGKGVTVLLMFYVHENKNKDNKKSAMI